MEEKEILSKNLIYYRKKNNLSQLDVAKHLNYSNKNISKWENGETTPSVFVLEKISKLYNVSIEDLLSNQEPKTQNDEKATEKKQNTKRKTLFNIIMLIMANTILYGVGTAIFYAFKLASLTPFNLGLIYLYFSPLSFLSINIYIRVIYKYVDYITISILNWLTCLSVYLSLPNIKNMALIFALGAAFQAIDICIALLVNITLKNKKEKVTNKKEKIKNKE